MIKPYVSEQRKLEATERCCEIVEKFLKKLPGSERTVMTLYYFGEMTIKEIGKFLGMSMNTIKSQLHRARKRLQADQKLLISGLETYYPQWRLTAEMFPEEEAK